MTSVSQLRTAAREIFDAALRAVDAGDAMRRALRIDGSNLVIHQREIKLTAGPIYSIAIGKAAGAMAIALEEQLGSQFGQGVISAPGSTHPIPYHSECEELSDRWQKFEGGHPAPNEESLRAAVAAFALLDRANEERANVIFLISGGGSAMMEWPISDQVTLENIRAANKVLVNCGADITEINAIRRAFSAVKGGRLAERAPNCQQVTLIISDVPLGEESIVASGPASAVPGMTRHTNIIIDRYKLRDALPSAIIKAIDGATTNPEPKDAAHWSFVLLHNNDALAAALDAAKGRGFASEIAYEIADLPINQGVAALNDRLDTMRAKHIGNDQPLCLISGGEFACPVQGDGVGGRNLETALRIALLNAGDKKMVALCAGTDGVDGNSPAAGAIVDNTTLERAKAIKLEAEEFLQRSDSYTLFRALDDAIVIGPTGTNVRDVRILIASD